ncbi:hypothetical protein [Sinomonas atrocyanea]|uniref:hypothetical protein n=1 Tax=Sinomonas atrocyanea TaxID=37927 RepID=UPI00278AB8DF|nr:hypothetical protein [Sinomonas atrocyanea]MDQ0261404.1 hypothetical protein [Sinomonas atrocyanea]MDR6623541.1 hypothetical protein [Sinomonas atrocyanea]
METVLARRRTAAAALTVGPAAVGLGLAAHIVSGGAPPPVTVLMALTAVTSLLAAAVAHLQLPSWAIGIGSGALQQVLHLLFTALAGPNAPLLPAAGHVHSHGLPSAGPAAVPAGPGRRSMCTCWWSRMWQPPSSRSWPPSPRTASRTAGQSPPVGQAPAPHGQRRPTHRTEAWPGRARRSGLSWGLVYRVR